MQEHEYIKEFIIDRFTGRGEAKTLASGNMRRRSPLKAKLLKLPQQLVDKRATTESQLLWLTTDLQLRVEGKTYPDVYEICQVRISCCEYF